MLARRQYEKELREQDDNANTDDEDVLEVFDQNSTSMEVDDSSFGVIDKGKGKVDPTSMNPPDVVPSRHRRPVIDPFAASGQYSFVCQPCLPNPKIGFVGDGEEDGSVSSSSSRRKLKSTNSDLLSSVANPQSLSHPEKTRKRKRKNKNLAPSPE